MKEAMKLVPVEPTQKMLDAPPNAYPADALVTWKAMLAAAPQPPAQQTCNCRWEGEIQVQECTLHQSHLLAIHEWAGRAKAAEAKLAEQQSAQQQEPDWLTGKQRIYLAQAWAMLDDYALDQRSKGNDSFANGAEASSHEIKAMLAAPQPAQRTWVGLVDNKGVLDFGNNHVTPEFAKGALWAEAKLKEENT